MANVRSSKWLRSVPLVLHVSVAALLGVGTTGCGALSALANPKAMFALNEPAPMSVVVRRAEVAQETAEQVERLIGETGLDEASEWGAKTALKKADAEALLKDIGAEAVYTDAKGKPKLRVVPAEARAQSLAGICSKEKQFPSLIGALNDEVATLYSEVASTDREIARMKGEREEADVAGDAKGATPAVKEESAKKKKELDEQIEKKLAEYKPKHDAFLLKLKDEAGKAPDDVKKRLATPLVNLQRAVADAKLANSVALVRYPLALSGMTDDIQTAARRIIGDVVEEHLGHRPDMSGFKPDVKLEGTDVRLSLNGIPVDKLGDIKPEEILSEATKRLVNYVKRVFALVSDASETRDMLDFEAEVLDTWVGGMKLNASQLADAGDDFGDLAVQTNPAAAKAAAASADDDGEKKIIGHRSPAGLLHATCKERDAAAPPKEEPEVKDPKKKNKGDAKKDPKKKGDPKKGDPKKGSKKKKGTS